MIDNNRKNSAARIKANAKYAAKTYKKKTIYVKLKDSEQIDAYMSKNDLTYTQFFNACLREKNIIDWCILLLHTLYKPFK